MPVETGDDVDNVVDDFSDKHQLVDDKATIGDGFVDDATYYPQIDEDKPTVGKCTSRLLAILLGPQHNEIQSFFSPKTQL